MPPASITEQSDTRRPPMVRAGRAVVWLAVIAASGSCEAVELSVERRDGDRVAVLADGELFALYHARSGHQPAVGPIVGPTGRAMTRSYPIGPQLRGEERDHPHHRSLWFAHQSVNGHDFWHGPKAKRGGRIEHQSYERVEANDGAATIVTRNRWLTIESTAVCDDERTITFGANERARWIAFRITLQATDGPVTFGDIKDGAFGVRVAGWLKVDAGGTLVNSNCLRNGDAWGMPAAWIDSWREIDGETHGLAVFSHRSNFRHPTRWHARAYGLLAANPFGEKAFPPAEVKQGPHTIGRGESLTLRYRVYLHTGTTKQADIAGVYRRYAEAGPR